MAEYVLIPQRTELATDPESKLMLKYLGGHGFREAFVAPFKFFNLMKYRLKVGEEIDLTLRYIKQVELETIHLKNIFMALVHLLTENSRDEFYSSKIIDYVASFTALTARENQRIKPIFSEKHKIISDKEIIYFALFNRALNASKIRAKEIVISAEETKLSERQLPYLGTNSGKYTCSDPFVKFIVSDNGRGIAPEDLPKIYQSDFSLSRSTELGLSLTDLVCRTLHGFEIVRSELGKGTTFELYLPKTYRPDKIREEPELPFR